MKNTENVEKLLKAMERFQRAYEKLLTAVDNYETDTNSSVNDLPGFAESYPFDVSLDELPLRQWITDVAERNIGIKFQIVNYEYLNTGGNTMVGIHEVWLPDEMKTVYCFTNEEGCTISPVDYISNEFDVDPSILQENYDWGRVTGYEKYFELLRRCFNDYTKDDCRYFGITRRIPYYLLSDELQKKVDADYLVWSEAESDGLVETNGVDIVEDPDYVSQFESEKDEHIKRLKELDKQLIAIEDFQRWHDNLINNRSTDDELDELYNQEYTLTINGKSIQLPFDADTFNNVDALLRRVIEQW